MNPKSCKGIDWEGLFPTELWKFSDELHSVPRGRQKKENLLRQPEYYAQLKVIQLWVMYLKRHLILPANENQMIMNLIEIFPKYNLAGMQEFLK